MSGGRSGVTGAASRLGANGGGVLGNGFIEDTEGTVNGTPAVTKEACGVGEGVAGQLAGAR